MKIKKKLISTIEFIKQNYNVKISFAQVNCLVCIKQLFKNIDLWHDIM